MISHKYKFIFIHIPKCAGSSIETAFGINVNNNFINKEKLFGWCDITKMYLQHATPQQLLDNNLISKKQWSNYYKLVIVRNSWDKVISDYFWFRETKSFKGSLDDYLSAKNSFKKFLEKGTIQYRGDHLRPQIEYMYLNGEIINYDKIIFFDKNNLDYHLKNVAYDLSLNKFFFSTKVQVGNQFKKHYSYYYSNKSKKRVYTLYKKDIDFFNFAYIERKNWMHRLKRSLNPYL